MAGFWDKEIILSTVDKNKSERIETKKCTKGEKSYIDIRISKVDKDGVYHPTSKGVAIPEEVWSDVINWE